MISVPAAARRARTVKVLARSQNVVPLPKAALDVIRIVDDEMAPRSDLEHAIAQDPALAARLFKLANSSFIRRGEPVTTIAELVRRLGLATIRNLAVAANIGNALGDSGCGAQAALWRHLITSAILSQAVATRLAAAGGSAAEAFLAGLIHDIGRLALKGEFAGAPMAHFTSSVREEREEIGIDHAAVSGHMAEQWKFPESVVSAVRNHHLSKSVSDDDPTALFVYIGDALASWHVDPNPDVEIGISPEVMERFGVYGEAAVPWAISTLETAKAALAQMDSSV